MVEIEKPRIECVDSPEESSYGKYVVEPLERGYGTTLGNSLRRILLSSLPGTAATSIKIAGVQHEFSTIPGVKEDVTEIVLNVKKIIARLHCQGVKMVYIDAAGECEVTAGDIKADGEVEILNPVMFLGGVIWNLISPWSREWWGVYFFITTIMASLIMGGISTVWFMIGGLIHMKQLFRDLEARGEST